MTIAWVFPGQGSQKVGMGEALCKENTEAKKLFELEVKPGDIVEIGKIELEWS